MLSPVKRPNSQNPPAGGKISPTFSPSMKKRNPSLSHSNRYKWKSEEKSGSNDTLKIQLKYFNTPEKDLFYYYFSQWVKWNWFWFELGPQWRVGEANWRPSGLPPQWKLLLPRTSTMSISPDRGHPPYSLSVGSSQIATESFYLIIIEDMFEML